MNNPINRIDSNGTFSFTLAAALIGAGVGALSQITSNLIFGDKWYEGVVGAAVGGAVYNAVSIWTGGSNLAASFASSAAEALVNETTTYLSGEKMLSKESIAESVETIAVDTVKNGIIYSAAGAIAGKVIPVNYKYTFL